MVNIHRSPIAQAVRKRARHGPPSKRTRSRRKLVENEVDADAEIDPGLADGNPNR